MPANVSALVLQARPGQELVCYAYVHRFTVNGAVLERGVLSDYASLALAKAVTTEEWVRETAARAKADVERKRLPSQYRLALTVAGKPQQSLFARSNPPGPHLLPNVFRP